MSQLQPHNADPNASAAPSGGSPPAIFTPPPSERRGLPLAPWVTAALVVLVVAGVLIFTGHKTPAPPPATLQPPAPYAASLLLSGFAMSESTSLSGGKLTYLDGVIHNNGSRTVDAVTVQVVFQNDEGLAPQIETVPLQLIRATEPYIDTEPVSAAAIKPGDERQFRLIFEGVPDDWNTQMPEVRIIHAGLQ